MTSPQEKTIYTIGHSTRTIEEFVHLLHAHGIKFLADVRTIAKSRYNPQFEEHALQASLQKADIEYLHMEKLGGLRHTTVHSKNLGWRNKSFRGYADYMSTQEFSEGLRELKNIAIHTRTAIMCAEAVPWRCHRSLIADALTVNDWCVLDIISEAAPRPHTLTPFLVVKDGTLTYPAEA